ncbi:MAG: hypothetical protein LBM70_10075, partial [Victivallales bacterium]|nr:hypothetical protein [Victivallales bacterium]
KSFSIVSIGVAIGFYSTVGLFPYRSSGHAITCWGFLTDKRYAPGSAGYYTALVISDPDDDRKVNGGGRKAPDRLVVLPIVWNTNFNKYQVSPEYVPNAYTLVEDFTFLFNKPASYATSGATGVSQAQGNITGGVSEPVFSNEVPQFTVREDVRFSFTVSNESISDAAGGVVELYVDGEFFTRLSVGALASGKSEKFKNVNFGRLDEGEYIFELFFDDGHENSAFANYDLSEFDVTPEKQAKLVFDEEDPFFLLSEESNVETDGLTSAESWGYGFSIQNIGRAASSGKEIVTMRLDGKTVRSSAIGKIGAKKTDFQIDDQRFGALSAGNHYVELLLCNEDGTTLDSTSMYLSVSGTTAPVGVPQFVYEDESLPVSEQPKIMFTEERMIVVSGAFQQDSDSDTWNFLLGDNSGANHTINLAFGGVAGDITLVCNSKTIQLSRGFNTVEVNGDFSITVGGAGSEAGYYRLAVSPPDKELSCRTPELILSKEYLRIGAGETVEVGLALGWDPGRELTVTVEDLFGGNPALSTNTQSFTFNSANWFNVQKFTLTLTGTAENDELCFVFSSPGVEERYLYVAVREDAALFAPTLRSVRAESGGVKLIWAANADDYDYIGVSRQAAGSGQWENIGEYDVLRGNAVIAGEDATLYSYRVYGIAPSGENSDPSNALAVDEDSGDETPLVPLLNGTPSAEINRRRAQICFQQASDDCGIDFYELRYSFDAGFANAVTVQTRELTVTLNNLANGVYFYSLRAVDRDGLQSAWSANKTFTIDYQAPVDADDYRLTQATALILNESHAESIGAGDNADLFTVNLDSGSYRIEGDFGAGRVNAVLYNSFGKKVMKVNSQNGIVSGKSKLLQGGTYFVEIVNRDEKAGEIDYNFAVKGEVFKAGTPEDNLPGVAVERDLTVSGDQARLSSGGYVGYGDGVDFYKFNTARGGVFSLQLDTASAKAKIVIGTLTSKGRFKALKEVSSGRDPVEFKLAGGEYYIKIKGSSAKSAKGNTDYSYSLLGDLFAGEANNSNDSLKTPQKLTLGKTQNGWLGYGDKRDCFEFELTTAGNVTIDLAGFDPGYKVGKELKLSLYNDRNKKLKLDGFTSRDLLEAGSYKVAIEIADSKKQQTLYSLSVLA